jgi:hypothetical protein
MWISTFTALFVEEALFSAAHVFGCFVEKQMAEAYFCIFYSIPLSTYLSSASIMMFLLLCLSFTI